MKITIEGERTEGKTTVMQIIALTLKRLGYAVTIDNRALFESLKRVSKDHELFKVAPREIQIVEKNSSEEVWDGRVFAADIGKIMHRKRQD